MADEQAATFESLERRRTQLEENVAKLRVSLSHWATWECEYDALKHEISSAHSPSIPRMLEIGRELGGKLVNEKEVQELVGKDGQTRRTANQVIDMISRRIDYVQQNLSTVEKQLDAAEKKLAGASVLLEPDMDNEEGLPFMDIEEELDEEGNVVSSSVSQPGKAAPEIIEALKKSGLKKAELDGENQTKSTNGEPSTPSSGSILKALVDDHSATASTKPDSVASQPLSRKSVSFSEDTKSNPNQKNLSPLEAYGYNESLADFNFTRGRKVIEVDEDDKEIASYPIIPQDESPESAALRRQMLQYGLSEVGQVVAEIDLEKNDNEYSDEELDDEFDEEYGSDEEYQDEDQYGRSTRRGVTDEYRQQMMDLEKKLNANMIENVGPSPDDQNLAAYSDDLRTLRVRRDNADTITDRDTTAAIKDDSKTIGPRQAKKGVRFADNLDISHTPEPARDPIESGLSRPISTSTISNNIVERDGSSIKTNSTTASKPAKVSRFKSSRNTTAQLNHYTLPARPVPEPQAVPTGPAGRTMANAIVEHDLRTSNPQPPDEFDPSVINREVQAQYHRMRNKLIQQQGGFTPSEEELEDPLMEEKDGKVKKVSRFKAARLKAEEL